MNLRASAAVIVGPDGLSSQSRASTMSALLSPTTERKLSTCAWIDSPPCAKWYAPHKSPAAVAGARRFRYIGSVYPVPSVALWITPTMPAATTSSHDVTSLWWLMSSTLRIGVVIVVAPLVVDVVIPPARS